jgi:osmotically-inducible protein OsmY
MSLDHQLQEAVLAELAWEPSITAAHIGVSANHGVVTLTGHVNTWWQKHAAEIATSRVKGVKAVAEELVVQLPFSVKRNDEDIARAAIDRLGWEASVPHDAIKVTVEKGWVTLTGQVAWHFEKEAARRVVGGLMGVVGVSDTITIKPRVDATDVSNDIRVALHRSWFTPDRVHVTADGGTVKLTGTVDTWRERQTAGATAWSAAGTTSVENELIVA